MFMGWIGETINVTFFLSQKFIKKLYIYIYI